MAIFLAEFRSFVLTVMLTNRKNVIHGVAKLTSIQFRTQGGSVLWNCNGRQVIMRDQEVFFEVAMLRHGAATLAHFMNPTLKINPSIDVAGSPVSVATFLAN